MGTFSRTFLIVGTAFRMIYADLPRFICFPSCFVGNAPSNVITCQGSGGTASFGSAGAEVIPGPPEIAENDPALGENS